MEEDKTWVFNAPQHYCDLPAILQDDDSELADQYFFAKSDDTVYYEPTDGDDTIITPWTGEVPEEKEEEQFQVIRRRSRSVGSRPLFLKKSEPVSRPPVIKPPAHKNQVKTNSSGDHPDHIFAEGLRQYSHVKAHDVPRVTKPVPFNLTMPKRKVNPPASYNGPSMAEGVQKWEKKTPDRFHTLRHGEVPVLEKVELHCTQAHTPQLTAFKRHRPVHAMSREDREKLEMEEMKKNQFKAHPVDEKVFKAPALPVRKELKTTKVEPFRLSDTHKKENMPPVEAEPEPDHQFHARPVPKNVFETPHVERKPIPVTVPQTPKFSEAGKASLYNWRRQRSKSNGSMGSARSNSSTGSLNGAGGERLKNTVIEPFSFESRDKQLQRKREMKIKKIMDEEKKMRQFHANPCPNFSHPFILPERQTLTTTRPVPFQLSCETRGVTKKEKFIQQMEELRLEEQKASQFKAQPARVLHQEPFRVKLDHNKTVSLASAVQEFHLSTEKRAAQRKNYDEFLKQREMENEAAKKELELLKQQQEEEEIQRLRQETVFHANPVRRFKSMTIKASNPDEITVPKTPKFMKK